MNQVLALETDRDGKLTKRGKLAAKFLGDIRQIPVEALKVGDTVREYIGFAGETAYFKVEWSEGRNDVYTVLMNHTKYGRRTRVLEKGAKLRIGWPPEVKEEQLKLAIAYQNSLNAWGRPRKGVQGAERQPNA